MTNPSTKRLQKAVRRDPNDPVCWYRLGVSYFQDGNREGGRTALIEALLLEKSDSELCAQIGDFLAHSELKADATRAYRNALAKNTGDKKTKIKLALLLIENEAFVEAREIIASSLSPNSPQEHDDPRFLALYAMVCAHQNRSEEAIRYLDQINPQSIQDVEFARRVAKLNVELGRTSHSVGAWRRLVDLSEDAESLTGLGIALSHLGEHREALTLLRKAVQLRPRSATARMNLGMAQLTAGSPNEAVQTLQEAVQIAPRSAQIRSNLGVVLKQLKLHDEAIEQFQQVVLLRPDWPDGYYNLALTLLATSEINAARRALLHAAALAPNDQEILDTLGELVSQRPQQETSGHSSSGTKNSASITGDLQTFPLPELLEFIRFQRFSGTLSITSGLQYGLVSFSGGQIISATSPGARQLGTLLVNRGALSSERLSEVLIALQAQPITEGRDLLGRELIKRELISRRILSDVLYEQLMRALPEMLGWEQSTFDFRRSPEADGAAEDVGFDVQTILLEIARLTDESAKMG